MKKIKSNFTFLVLILVVVLSFIFIKSNQKNNLTQIKIQAAMVSGGSCSRFTSEYSCLIFGGGHCSWINKYCVRKLASNTDAKGNSCFGVTLLGQSECYRTIGPNGVFCRWIDNACTQGIRNDRDLELSNGLGSGGNTGGGGTGGGALSCQTSNCTPPLGQGVTSQCTVRC